MRLIERIQEDFRQGRRLTLVFAPAGFGKSTLVREAVESQDTSPGYHWTPATTTWRTS
jgi:ATP/maltotriose-dependent transcriptional regulator MalT